MDRPILFSPQMARECLRGVKTQTRRVAKDVSCPYGKIGDDLWVRETWRPCAWGSDFDWIRIEYKAGGSKTVDPFDLWGENTDGRWEGIIRECQERGNQNEFGNFIIKSPLKWRPGIFMPRAAARILLSIQSVRLDRLQSISESDARSEGFGSISEFHAYWDKLNKKRKLGWEQDPMVWVVEFSVKSNQDSKNLVDH